MALNLRSALAGPRRARAREFVSQFVVFAVPIGLATAVAVIMFYRHDVQITEQSLLEAERSRLELRVALIRQRLDGAVGDLRRMAGQVARVPASGATSGDGATLLGQALQPLCGQAGSQGVLWLATWTPPEELRVTAQARCVEGRPVATVADSSSGSPGEPLTELLLQALAKAGPQDVVIGAMRAGRPAGVPAEALRPVVPLALRLPGGGAGAGPGAARLLVLEVDLQEVVADMVPADGNVGALALVEESGRYLRQPLPGQQWVDTLLPGPGQAYGSVHGAVWEALRHSEQGTLATAAGRFTFATLRLGAGTASGTGGVDAPAWKVVSHIPRDAIDAGRAASARKFGLLIPAPLLVTLYLAHVAVRRRRAARGLEESEHYLRQIIDSMEDAILTSDAAGRIERVNAATVELFGFQSKEMVPANLALLLPLERLKPDSELARLWRGETALRRMAMDTLELQHDDGTRFPAELVLMEAELGGEPRYLWIVRDIRERQAFEAKQTAERMRFFHQTKMAEIGLIAAGIIHEVGNPIAAISGMVSVLADEARQGQTDWSASAREHLKLIAEQVQRLAGITREISDFVRTRPGVVELFDFNSLVQRTVRLVQYDSRWRLIRLELELDLGIPAIMGIQDQIAQVLMNLLVNAGDAVEARPPGERTVNVRTESRETHLLLTVRDNGHGMSDEAMHHAFDSFYTTKPEGKGTGLGLTLCQMIVAAHHGSIEIDSAEDRGATIQVSLPVLGQAGSLAS